MASLEAAQRQNKEALPSINNFDFEKFRFDPIEGGRSSIHNGIGLGAMMGSPPSRYSIPPPPYTAGGGPKTQSTSGYMSPTEIASRRGALEEKESPKGTTSLPSISEALNNTQMAAPTQSFKSISSGGPTAAHTISDAPRGPGNPFSQPIAPTSSLRTSNLGSTDTNSILSLPPPPLPPDSRSQPSVLGSSPRLSSSSHKSSISHPTGATALDHILQPSFTSDSSRDGFSIAQFTSKYLPSSMSHYHFDQKSKPEETPDTFAKSEPRPYHDIVKRHLEIYDAELALKELMESSAHTLEFASSWMQRYHQSNRASYLTDGLPNTVDVDDMLHVAHRMVGNLNKLREVSVVQQDVLNEQRARLARGQNHDDEQSQLNDEYKIGGFAGGDAKKRRGKAAPPGRCHSCNRAETPEWRRGPDGARTLCNACGLHYAKLTRKMGSNKVAAMSGSNLRPKNLTDTRP